MGERVVEVVRRVFREKPDIDVKFTSAVRGDSYQRGSSVLFLHPMHQPLVDEIRLLIQRRAWFEYALRRLDSGREELSRSDDELARASAFQAEIARINEELAGG